MSKKNIIVVLLVVITCASCDSDGTISTYANMNLGDLKVYEAAIIYFLIKLISQQWKDT